MRMRLFALVLLLPAMTNATELDLLPLGRGDLAHELGSAPAGSVYDAEAGSVVEADTLAARLATADIVLLGEEHTAMDQKLFHAELVEGIAATGRPVVLAMEFFQRGDGPALERWTRGEIDDRELLEVTGWYDRGGYRWEYYRPVMEVARVHGMTIVGANVPREIPRAVNRGGLDGLSEEQRLQVGEVKTDGSPEHRYLISRYFGDTVALLPPGWFDNMYAAQCLWDVVMARSLLEHIAEGTTVVLIVGSGHVAYDLGIPRRLDEEREAARLPRLKVTTFCPATAPAPDPEGDPSGHPMGGGHEASEDTGAPAQFARSLADYVGIFSDRGGIEAFPTVGLRLKADDADRPMVSMVWPDTLAKEIGFETGDRILDVNGVAPKDLGELRFMLAAIEWGQRLGIQIGRGEETVEIAALLFPAVDTTESSAAPGYVVEAMDRVGVDSSDPVTEGVVSDDRAMWSLVSEDGVPLRAEVFRERLLEQVHELDDNGRTVRSLYRTARDGGAVEIRYERDETGRVVKSIRIDRAGHTLE